MIAAVTTKGFDAVLVLHVLSATWALSVLLVLRAAATSVRSGGPLPPSAQRTFAARREFAGRAVHLVPATGIALLALSRGAYGFDDPFVVVGLALWVVAAVALEARGFPARRRTAVALRGGDAVSPARVLQRATELAALALVVAAAVMVAASR